MMTDIDRYRSILIAVKYSIDLPCDWSTCQNPKCDLCDYGTVVQINVKPYCDKSFGFDISTNHIRVNRSMSTYINLEFMPRGNYTDHSDQGNLEGHTFYMLH